MPQCRCDLLFWTVVAWHLLGCGCISESLLCCFSLPVFFLCGSVSSGSLWVLLEETEGPSSSSAFVSRRRHSPVLGGQVFFLNEYLFREGALALWLHRLYRAFHYLVSQSWRAKKVSWMSSWCGGILLVNVGHLCPFKVSPMPWNEKVSDLLGKGSLPQGVSQQQGLGSAHLHVCCTWPAAAASISYFCFAVLVPVGIWVWNIPHRLMNTCSPDGGTISEGL